MINAYVKKKYIYFRQLWLQVTKNHDWEKSQPLVVLIVFGRIGFSSHHICMLLIFTVGVVRPRLRWTETRLVKVQIKCQQSAYDATVSSRIPFNVASWSQSFVLDSRKKCSESICRLNSI